MRSPVCSDSRREVFLRAVRMEVRQAGLSIAGLADALGRHEGAVHSALHTSPDQWSFYRAVLDASSVEEAKIKRYHEAWGRLCAGDGERPAVEMNDSDLRAASVTEFIELLRRIQVRSGLNPAQIAIKANMPRSTAYRFVDVKRNGALPTKLAQVEAFVTACSVPGPQIEKVRALWTSLHETRVLPSRQPDEAAPRLPTTTRDRGDEVPAAIAPSAVPVPDVDEPTAADANLLPELKRYANMVVFFLVSAVSVATVGMAGGWELLSSQPALGLMAMPLLLILCVYGISIFQVGSDGTGDFTRRRALRQSSHASFAAEFYTAPAVIGEDAAAQDKVLVAV